jgi:cell fate (sporulation/competence/biofilm development) regulator YmcA (YheA/YmcA/DUF963 family)
MSFKTRFPSMRKTNLRTLYKKTTAVYFYSNMEHTIHDENKVQRLQC